MAGKQAKLLSDEQIALALRKARLRRYPLRDRAMLLLSHKAGLRAAEIAQLAWPMVLRPDGRLADHIALADRIAKKGSGRTIPLHPSLKAVLEKLRQLTGGQGHVIQSERGGGLRPSTVVSWFREHYAAVGLKGCSSHSGRRTFITKAARLVYKVGGSLRDVQQLAGHRSLNHTQTYIEGDTVAKRRLVALI